MTERADPAEVFSWHMIDAITYCADLAEAGKGSPQAIEYARSAAAQMALIIAPRNVERFEIAAEWVEKSG
jgi:hypothetical protein